MEDIWFTPLLLTLIDPVQEICGILDNISENETEGIIRARADIDGMNVVKESMN